MQRLKQLKRLPSPAMIVALAALFIGLGGTSYAALSAGSITGREIQKGTIRNVHFKRGTLRGQEFKRDSLGGGAVKEEALDASKLRTVRAALTADRADSATTATSAGTAAGLTHQVAVGADGARGAARGVVSVAKTETGRYQVIFDRDVTACAYHATLAILPPPEERRDAPVTGEIAVAPLAGNVNGVVIATADSAGVAADRGFHLITSC